MNAAIAQALNDHRVMNDSGQWWARLLIFFHPNHDEPQIFLRYGVIHHNGFKEIELRTVKYYLNPDGSVGVA